jgi:hypothetical protein
MKFKEDNSTITVFRPVGPLELELVRRSGYKHWPPRLPEQPIFYIVTSEDYARQISRQWNVKDSGAGYVMRFNVHKSLMDQYQVHQVGGVRHAEWWVPAQDVEKINAHIVGLIELIEEFHS